AAFIVHGRMAVMASSTLDKVPSEVKAPAFSSADAMVLDAESNVATFDGLFDEAELPQVPATDSHPPPMMNGTRTTSGAAARSLEPTTNVSSGIDPMAQFLPDSQDVNSLFEGSDMGATSVVNAAEAPTSDLRDEAGPDSGANSLPDATTQLTADSTQHVPETQLPTAHAGFGDAMDISQNSVDASAPSTNAPPTTSMTELSLQTQQTATTVSLTQAMKTQSPTDIDHEMNEAPPSGKVRSREEDDDEDVRDAKRTKTEEEAEEQAQFKVPEKPGNVEHTNGNGVVPLSPMDAPSLQTAALYEDWGQGPITVPQSKFLLERVRNTKKIKVSTAFREPVNAEALGIPQYFDIIAIPMDLSTMEAKLKEGKYGGVRDFMEDLDRIIDNSYTFNGKDHPVTQAGYNMRAYFLKGMNKMPSPDVEEPVKSKPKKPAVTTAPKPRRESRAPAPAATVKSPTLPTPTVASPQSAWPLNADGLPLIRRDSNAADGRPKREIHRPPPKDLPYTSKPKKKKYQQELRFCESVMAEIMKTKYYKIAWPFMKPVDPVALNIPTYLKVIKKPMDFGTIEKNLKTGQYVSAKDFYNDAQLVFQNCFKFNVEGDDIFNLGRQYQELFNSLWSEKSSWLTEHAPTAEAQSPDYASSADEEEEEEEEEEVDPTQKQILEIQKQIAILNENAQALLQKNAAKRTSPKAASKKKKVAQPTKKKSLTVPPPATKAPKSKPRASRPPPPLSFNQKQEISEGISTLGDNDMRKAVQIIRNGCPHLANVNDDEMEIDMDEISDDTLRELFKFIKSVRGPAKPTYDDDFEPPKPKAAAAHKPKKNKPMGKREQEESIKKIQDQLRNFDQHQSGTSESPQAQDESSDDESSGSESEEE
ncbi:Bromodomain-containing protein, partial [Amniculicola lignicola CBS 123094]